MRIGILGSGLMGGKPGTIFARAGHVVRFSYSRSDHKLKRLSRCQGNARAGMERSWATRRTGHRSQPWHGRRFRQGRRAAGHAVVVSGRDRDAASKDLGQSNDLLAVKLDLTRRADAEAAVRTAVDRFGRIDVLVNSAADFYAAYFEELSRSRWSSS
jgi:hypothetical protein